MAITGTTLFCDLFDNVWQIEIRTDEKFMAFSNAANDSWFFEYKEILDKLNSMNTPNSRVVMYDGAVACRV